MTDQEAKKQEERIARFRLLDAARSALYSTKEKMNRKSGEGEGVVTSRDDPFTGNTRESRRVAWMSIGFTSTLGGEPPVVLKLDYLDVQAYELGRAIEALIAERLAEINAEIEKL